MALSTRVGDRLEQEIAVAAIRSAGVAPDPQVDILVLGDRARRYRRTSRNISCNRTVPKAADRRLFSISANRSSAVMIVSD